MQSFKPAFTGLFLKWHKEKESGEYSSFKWFSVRSQQSQMHLPTRRWCSPVNHLWRVGNVARFLLTTRGLGSIRANVPKKAPQRIKPTNVNCLVISACNFPSADNTNVSRAETSSETRKSSISTNRADGFQAKSCTIKCTMCEKNFSKIALMTRH